MEDLSKPPVMGKKIFKLIKKYKILLLQDKIFPNLVSEITGENISGSWWGHSLANPIYNGLQWLEQNRSILVIKLIGGKVTYIDESLFPQIYSIVCEAREWQIKKMKEVDLQILNYISKKKRINSDDPQLAKISKDPKKSLSNLEKRLLIYATEKHTSSGKHIKEYLVWKESKITKSLEIEYSESISHIENIVSSLNQKSGASLKLPWQ